MQAQFIVDGETGVKLLLSPDNAAEEELLKLMLKQDNELNEVRSSVMILNKTYRNAVLISSRQRRPVDNPAVIEQNQS